MPLNATQEKIYSHPVLNSVIDNLLFNQFARGKTKLSPRQILSEPLKHSVWLASILASSVNERHQVKAQLFTSLLYLEAGSDMDVERVCYLLMSRLGNLVATNLFLGRAQQDNSGAYETALSFDSLLSFQLAFQRETKTINVGKDSIVATRFQRQLWDNMGSKRRLAISAPTSSGKSFITKKHIKQLFSKSEEIMHCIYIVPSRVDIPDGLTS